MSLFLIGVVPQTFSFLAGQNEIHPQTYTIILKNDGLRPDSLSDRCLYLINREDQRIWAALPPVIWCFWRLMLTTVWKQEIRGKPMNVRILVVDDNAKVRDGLRLLLQSHADWEVCGEAADGIEAIEKCRQLRPDLLIVDVSMPRMNGLDASLEVLKLSPKILILLYTSYLTAQLIDVAHKAGIRGTISKDTMHLVVVGLEALLRGEEYSGPPN
jgi:CheY-like chemotaxis protein